MSWNRWLRCDEPALGSFERYLKNTENYFAAVYANGGTPWFARNGETPEEQIAKRRELWDRSHKKRL